jgi:hypothetical protein
MRPLPVFLLLRAAAAQSLIDPAAVPIAPAQAPRNSAEHPLACQARPIRPILTFGLRLQAGYIFQFPLGAYSGAGHSLTVLTRITAEGAAQPVYLIDRLRLPADSPPNAIAEASGSYFLGAGHYGVEWLLFDDAGRACRKQWEVDAQPERADRDVKLVMEPGTVTDLSLGASRTSARPRAANESRRITILLDAAPIPVARNRGPVGEGSAAPSGGFGRGGGRGMRGTGTRMPQPTASESPRAAGPMHAGDRILLLGALSAMLERLPAAAVRLVVFNLEQQKELYRADDFGMESLNEVARTMNQLQLGTIDYRTLQNRKGHVDLVAGLVNGELRAAPPSDAVIFLGPRERLHDKVPDELLDPRGASSPRFFFLAYQRPAPIRAAFGEADGADDSPGGRGGRRGGGGDLPRLEAGDGPDTVSLAVGKLKGKTIAVESPRQFSKAIHAIEQASRR